MVNGCIKKYTIWKIFMKNNYIVTWKRVRFHPLWNVNVLFILFFRVKPNSFLLQWQTFHIALSISARTAFLHNRKLLRASTLFLHCVTVIPTHPHLPCRHTFPRSAVLHAGLRIIEAVVVSLTSPIIEGLALHRCHVEVVALEERPARTLLLVKPADLGNLWEREIAIQSHQLGFECTNFTFVLVGLEMVCVVCGCFTFSWNI